MARFFFRPKVKPERASSMNVRSSTPLEGTEIDAARAGCVAYFLDSGGCRMSGMQVARTKRREHENAHSVHLRSEIRQEIQRRCVGPMQVLNDDDQRLARGDVRKAFDDCFEVLTLGFGRRYLRGAAIDTRKRIQDRTVWTAAELAARPARDPPTRIGQSSG